MTNFRVEFHWCVKEHKQNGISLNFKEKRTWKKSSSDTKQINSWTCIHVYSKGKCRPASTGHQQKIVIITIINHCVGLCLLKTAREPFSYFDVHFDSLFLLVSSIIFNVLLICFYFGFAGLSFNANLDIYRYKVRVYEMLCAFFAFYCYLYLFNLTALKSNANNRFWFVYKSIHRV